MHSPPTRSNPVKLSQTQSNRSLTLTTLTMNSYAVLSAPAWNPFLRKFRVRVFRIFRGSTPHFPPLIRLVLQCNSAESCNSDKILTARNAKNPETRTYVAFSLRSLRSLWLIHLWLRLAALRLLCLSCRAIGSATADRGKSIQVPLHEPFTPKIKHFQSCSIVPNRV